MISHIEPDTYLKRTDNNAVARFSKMTLSAHPGLHGRAELRQSPLTIATHRQLSQAIGSFSSLLRGPPGLHS